MSDLKIYSIKDNVTELPSTRFSFENELQTLVENNMETFFGVRFLKSEYRTSNNDRMDSIGIDENNCPVIFEYKRSKDDNVINQGLFYLNWLLDHKGDFKVLVIDKLGLDAANEIDWSAPSVICIAQNFNKFDVDAVELMQRNIKLVRYKKYRNDLILFEQLNTPKANSFTNTNSGNSSSSHSTKTHIEKVDSLSEPLKTIYNSVCKYIESLGTDLQVNQLKLYLAYKKVQNIVCIEVTNKRVILRLKLDPDTVDLEDGFSEDKRNVGHYGTGDLEITLKSAEDFEKAKPLILRAYDEG